MTSSARTSTIVAASIGAVVTGLIAYAVYFDHRRRTDPKFRKALKRESRREARAAREEVEAQGALQKKAIKAAVEQAKAVDYPADVEEKEAYFLNEVGRGEVLCQDESNQMEAALCFFKALKVYPQPGDLIRIYDKTVPKPILDILAEMIASDPSISVGALRGGPSSEGSLPGVDD
ncbi:MAG: mitochondrial import receptor subunit (Tom20) [Lasallia pustulata]|uniref:Mitochondrial import receptor subunit TOM20 n=1 Tax=Lasallia pustulata TaxID=136370 RepID=A0A5M8PEP1_9LECA|nr:MAG: mitochondrial import receptor subunit (Tom20) [Lasallia pustulata]